jgi:hypothetical protein
VFPPKGLLLFESEEVYVEFSPFEVKSLTMPWTWAESVSMIIIRSAEIRPRRAAPISKMLNFMILVLVSNYYIFA